ncbi:hypothetical protein [Acrocarpospora phusangensis]|uniref:hypothetical protein n=1 Tax=Acrocarpospora phusangensis TaxID=1070424 RepID=UPI00195224F0|nr:hypothetical protein [Acrocarpospora phusangensis]
MSGPEFGAPEELGREPVRWSRNRVVVAGMAAAFVVVTGVGVAAAAASPSPTESGTPTPGESGTPSAVPSPEGSEKPDRGLKRVFPLRGMFGALHGEFVVPKEGGGYETVATQTGKVTAVDQGSITVRSEDGFSRAYTVTDETRVNGGREGIASVQVDDEVTVMATVEAEKATATMVIDLTRPAGKGWFRHPGGAFKGELRGDFEWGPGRMPGEGGFHRRIPINPDDLKRLPQDSGSPTPESATPTPTI